MKTYQELLKNLREDRDLKQSEIADLIGTTQQQYSKYETGESELPLRTLVILADFYNVSTDYFLGRTDCRDGVQAQNQKIHGGYTVGALTSDVLFLNATGRDAVIDYISLQKLRLTCTCRKKRTVRIKNHKPSFLLFISPAQRPEILSHIPSCCQVFL